MGCLPHLNPSAVTLVNWYDRHRRHLPWRAEPGIMADPYHVWLSEIMLQQTTVAVVGDYFTKFIARWPHIDNLADTSLDDVLAAWAGLGYYARARNLHKCARIVSNELCGQFPDNEAELRHLPGIGPYTAGAIAAIAFNRPAVALDGNVERVMARLFKITTPLPAAKTQMRERAEALVNDYQGNSRYGDFAQGMMDLGAVICTPRQANCQHCPWANDCLAHHSRAEMPPENLPIKPPKKPRPTRYGTVFWVMRKDGAVLLRRRVEKGLLGGMMEFPSSDWCENPMTPAPFFTADWQDAARQVEHVFTHFRLILHIKTTLIDEMPTDAAFIGQGYQWAKPQDFAQLALPSLMRKVAAAVLS